MNIKKISLCIIMFFTYLSGSVADIFEIENISLNEKIELHIKDIEKTSS